MLIALLAALAPGARAQVVSDSCAPIPAARGATITFGLEGGLLRPRTVAMYAGGLVRAGGDSATDSLKTVSPDAVAGLAHLARGGGFWNLSMPANRPPPKNPDAARAFIAVSLTCGSRRAEYVTGEPMPAAFAELKALLEAVTGRPWGRPLRKPEVHLVFALARAAGGEMHRGLPAR